MDRIELSGKLLEASVALEKAKVVQNDLREGYFANAEPEECMLKFYYNDASARCCIIGDYLQQIEETLGSICKMVG